VGLQDRLDHPAERLIPVRFRPPFLAEFQKSLLKTEDACKKLKTAVANVGKNRARFPHIDDKELDRRQAIVGDLESKLEAMRSVFFSRETKGKLDSDQKAELHKRTASEVDSLRAGGSSSSAASLNSYQRSNEDYMKDHAQQQLTMRREQDEALGSLSNSLSRVNEMAVTIKTELSEQDKILDDIDKDMDVAQGKMDQALGAIEKLLKTKDRCQLWTILILVVVFVIVAIVAFKMLIP
jgi:chromosome segregation ATPase